MYKCLIVGSPVELTMEYLCSGCFTIEMERKVLSLSAAVSDQAE